MKKLLTIAIASASVAAVASTFSPTIGVNTLSLSKKNNIIPVQFTSLESAEGTAVKASALVCTNNIPVGSHLYVFQNGSYSGWELQSTGWAPQTEISTADGISPGTPASSQTLATGTAIWLSFAEAPKSAVSVAFYGQVATTTNSTIEAGAANLICNPTSASVNLVSKLSSLTLVKGDKILPVGDDFSGYYVYSGSAWSKVEPGKVPTSGIAEISLSANQGVWFYSKSGSSRVINW